MGREGRHVLQNMANFITKWRRYIVRPVLQSTGGKQDKRGRTTNYCNFLLIIPMIFQATDSLPLRILEKLSFCQNQKQKEMKNNLEMRYLLYLNLLFLNSFKISSKLPIIECECKNVASATFLKSLSTKDIFLRILQECKNIFLKE